MNYLPKRKNYFYWIRALFSVVIITSLLAGCHLPWQGKNGESTQVGELEIREATREVTSEPRDDLPPSLVEVSPVPGSVIALNQPISFYFNQPMDKGSVEAAINFEPRVSGHFSWEDQQILSFTPDQNLAPGSELQLVINTSAQAANKKSLNAPIAVTYQTADELRALQVMPEDQAEEVDPESVLFVAFNQPVVPLGEEAAGDPAFSLSPEVPGEGRWLNTTTYIFTPDPSMGGGITYNISLNESLVAVSGAGLDAQDLDFSFTTTTPKILEVLPSASDKLRLDGPIEVRFNIRMDPKSVAENFILLAPDDSAVEGSFEWDEDYQGFNFIPDAILERGGGYVIQLGEDAQSFGGLPLGEPYKTIRTTYPALNVASSSLPEFTSYYGQYGQYEIQLTAPLSKENFKDYVTLNPKVASQGLYFNDEQMRLFVNGYFQPDTDYTITLDANLEDKWGGPLGQDLTYTFVTPSATPALTVPSGYTSNNMLFLPDDVSEIVLQATNINTVTLEIAPISVNDLLTLVHPENYEYRRMFLPGNLEVSTHNLDLTRNVNQAVSLPLAYQGEPLSPGIYFLGMTSADLQENEGQNYQKYYVIVSDNHVVMKVSPDQAFVWAAQLTDYSSLANAEVSIYNTEGDLITSGKTDSDGLFIEEISWFVDPFSNFLAILGEPGQNHFAFSISAWNQGYALYEQGILQNTLPRKTQAYIYTDRPIYRPGDTVYFKAILFDRENGLPVASELGQVDVTVNGDPGMSGIPVTLFSQTLSVSQFGTVEGSVVLPQDASPGLFHIALKQGEEFIESLYFDVAKYRKPDLEMSLGLDPDEILSGEDMSAQFQANYYFGLPVAEQPFTWTLYSGDAPFDLPGYEVGPMNTTWLMPRVSGYSSLGAVVARGEGLTDRQGQSTLRFTEADMGLTDVQKGLLQKMTLEVTVTDESGFPVSYRESALVHSEDFYIGVKPESYFGSANTPFSFTLLTVDWEKKALGQKPLEATFEAIEWEVEETGSPEMPYQYVEETTLIDTASPVTGADGLARITFTPPQPGTYRLTLKSGGAVTQVLVWAAGEGSPVWPKRTHNLIALTADAESYQVGQTAQVFFPNPFTDGAKALITIERGLVMETRVVDVDGAGYSLQVPITGESIPNIYLSVMLLGKDQNGNPDFRQGVHNIAVTPLSKTLNVDLLLNPTTTEPGELVSASLFITDQQGNPVQGEFSVAVVDKALLALVDANAQPIVDAFYSQQPLAVQTAFSLKTYATQLALSSDLGIGGGGGDMDASTTLREAFPDTALWEGQIVTGSDGRAQLEIPLPDSLTTWVVDVRGLTEDFMVGQAEAEIITQKALMVRPVTPRFLVDGDRVELAAVVHNNTSESREVDISLSGSGFILEEAINQTQTVAIEPGDSAHVTWWVVVESKETAELIFQAVSGDLSDGAKPEWGDLTISRYAMPSTFSTAGLLEEEGQVLELVSLPVTTEPSSGSLSLDLQPSLTASIIDGLEALETPNYSDTLSILSGMLANITVYQALQELGIETPQLEEDLSNLVGESLNALLDMQRFDGGWLWWGGTGSDMKTSDAFITAYSILGLQAALDAGFEVDAYYIERVENFLSNHLVDPQTIEEPWELDQLAFQLYAMRDSNFGLNQYTDAIYDRRSDLSPWSLGLFALTLDHIEGNSIRVNTLLGDLEAAAVRSETGVYWESTRDSWMLPGTPLFNTAVGVLTLARLDPASTSLSPALRYMVTHWDANASSNAAFESAWVLMGITAGLKGTGDYQADYTFQAFLNDRLFAEGEASATVVKTQTSILDLYPESPNALLIERGDGPGTLYYRVDLQTFQPADEAEPIDKGINIERKYYIAGEGCPGEENCTPIDALSLDPGDPSQMITVALRVTLSNDMVNLMLEDFLPAGTEILNKKFLTSQTVQEDSDPIFNPRRPFDDGWGWWYFNQPQIYDNRILWTSDYVPASTYILTYELIPYQRGDFQVLPAHAWMYFYPEVQGTSAGSLFSIE